MFSSKQFYHNGKQKMKFRKILYKSITLLNMLMYYTIGEIKSIKILDLEV